MDATKIEVKMTLADLQTYQEAKHALEEKAVALEKQLAETVLSSDTTGVTRRLAEGIEAAREIVAFAVAYLAPETVRGWPHEALVAFADVLGAMPGVGSDYQSQAADWKAFAREIQQVDEMRLHRERVRHDARD